MTSAIFKRKPGLTNLYLTRILSFAPFSSKLAALAFCVLGFHDYLYAQPANDHCSNATLIDVQSFEFQCVQGTTKEATSDIIQNSPCEIQGFPTVWYVIRPSGNAQYLNLHVATSDPKVIPVLRLFRSIGGCNEWIPEPNGFEDAYCFIGENGQAGIIGLEVNGTGEFYLAVSTLSYANGADFELCVNYIEDFQSCVWRKEIVIERQTANPQYSPFFPGEEVRICMNVNEFSGVNNGCQWFQGLVPTFGEAWDTNSSEPDGEPENSTINGEPMGVPNNGNYSTSTWDWFNDVDYHYNHFYYQVGDTDGNGTVDICNNLYDPYCPNFGGINGGCCGPCWGSPLGDELPPGWFAYGINGTCAIPGPPVRVDWGDGNTCGSGMGPWEFCFTRKIDPSVCFMGGDANSAISFSTFTDGEVGSWTGGANACALDKPVIAHVPIGCLYGGGGWDPDSVIYPKPVEIDVCSGDTILFEPGLYTLNDDHILYWKYDIYKNNHTSGFMTVDDSIIIIETNTNPNPLYIELEVYGHATLQQIAAVVKVSIRIHSRSNADFYSTVRPDGVQFSVLYDGPWTHQWMFGDGDTSTLIEPKHYYNLGGQFLVTHIVEGECGIDTVEKWVDLPPKLPNAIVEIPTQHYCPGDTIRVSNQSTGIVDSVSWIAPEAQIIFSDDTSILIVYSEEGDYDIGLIVLNQDGADTLFYQDTIKVMPSPEASFYFVIEEDFVRFFPSEYGNWNHHWLLGDGAESDELFLEHDYLLGGEYLVTHIVNGQCGTDTFYNSILVPPQLPNVIIEIPATDFCVHDTIQLRSLSTGYIDSITWFVPGATTLQEDSASILISYAEPGDYSVALSAHNRDGTESILHDDTLTVLGVPQANFTFGIFDLLVRFNYSGSASDDLQWFLGDSIALSGVTVEKQFDSTGTYPSMLIATNMCGADTHRFNLILIPTGISVIDENSAFMVNPNPTADVVNIIYTGESTKAVLRIYNAIGQITYTDHSISETRDLKLSLRDLGLTGGVVCFVLETSKTKFIRRVLVVN